MHRSFRFARPLVAGFALALAARPVLAQATHPRAFTIDDALGVRSARIEDVSKDGHWIALGVRGCDASMTVTDSNSTRRIAAASGLSPTRERR
jgi:hypothetical protein